ncbi:MAG: hypothetical protein KBC64_00035 [Simkaniaceae bacterium]|nr:hypothetical protein [Simkaniaceae bacterium]
MCCMCFGARHPVADRLRTAFDKEWFGYYREDASGETLKKIMTLPSSDKKFRPGVWAVDLLLTAVDPSLSSSDKAKKINQVMDGLSVDQMNKISHSWNKTYMNTWVAPAVVCMNVESLVTLIKIFKINYEPLVFCETSIAGLINRVSILPCSDESKRSFFHLFYLVLQEGDSKDYLYPLMQSPYLLHQTGVLFVEFQKRVEPLERELKDHIEFLLQGGSIDTMYFGTKKQYLLLHLFFKHYSHDPNSAKTLYRLGISYWKQLPFFLHRKEELFMEWVLQLVQMERRGALDVSPDAFFFYHAIWEVLNKGSELNPAWIKAFGCEFICCDAFCQYLPALPRYIRFWLGGIFLENCSEQFLGHFYAVSLDYRKSKELFSLLIDFGNMPPFLSAFRSVEWGPKMIEMILSSLEKRTPYWDRVATLWTAG